MYVKGLPGTSVEGQSRDNLSEEHEELSARPRMAPARPPHAQVDGAVRRLQKVGIPAGRSSEVFWPDDLERYFEAMSLDGRGICERCRDASPQT